MSTTEFNITSPTNLAQSIAHKKTPIVVAIAEYVRSLMHNNPDTPYAFGEVKQGVREHVWWTLSSVGEVSTIKQHPESSANVAQFEPKKVVNG